MTQSSAARIGGRRVDTHRAVRCGRRARAHAMNAVIVAAVLLLCAPSASRAQPRLEVPAGAQPAPTFDARRATDAYLATVPADKKARSDAYFEGGYWILMWSFLYGVAVLWLLLRTGASAAMRDRAERLTRRRPLQTAVYWVQFVVAVSILQFPWSVYTDFVREHQYGLATQTFGPWLGDQLKGLGVAVVFGALGMMVLYGVLRRVGRSWWLWATGVLLAINIVAVAIAPVFVFPLFNTYSPLTDARVRDPILRLARANGIPVDNVYVVDQSRQTTRISANVSGFLGTTRISLNDNLLRRGSLEEIEAVLGHEMGHYVLNHMRDNILESAFVVAIGFWLVGFTFERLRVRRPEWRIASVGDVAGLPLIALLFSTYQFVATPINNTIIRTQEYEADIFGLNASMQPDGFANASLKLGEYRKLDPGRLEEFLFFDHPSGRTRIFSAMRWKAEHLP